MSLRARWYREKLQKKAAKGLRGYPVATVAYYGPDDKRASKVAVGIIEHEGLHADLLKRWYSEASDVRTEPEIVEAVVRFIEQHGVKSVVVADRIIGCPHEEGVEYPAGEKCPHCSFWADRDRWGGEVIQ